MSILYLRKLQQFSAGKIENMLKDQIINFAKPGSQPLFADIDSYSIRVQETGRMALVTWDNSNIFAYIAHTQYPQQLYPHIQIIFKLCKQLYRDDIYVDLEDYFIKKVRSFLDKINNPTVNPDMAFADIFNVLNAPVNNTLNQLIIDQLQFNKKNIYYASVCYKNKFAFRFGTNQILLSYLHRVLQTKDTDNEEANYNQNLYIQELQEQYLAMPQYEVADLIYGNTEDTNQGTEQFTDQIITSNTNQNTDAVAYQLYSVNFQIINQISVMYVSNQQGPEDYYNQHQLVAFLNTDSGLQFLNEQIIESKNRLYERMSEDDLVIYNGIIYKINEFKIDQRLVLDFIIQINNNAKTKGKINHIISEEDSGYQNCIADDQIFNNFARKFENNIKCVQLEGLYMSFYGSAIGIGKNGIQLDLFQ